MFGMYVQGYTSCIYYDNEAVVNNSSIPIHALNKKHNSVSFHLVREVIASEWLTLRELKIRRTYSPRS